MRHCASVVLSIQNGELALYTHVLFKKLAVENRELYFSMAIQVLLTCVVEKICSGEDCR